MKTGRALFVLCVLHIVRGIPNEEPEDSHGVKPPTKCEVCKYLVTELKTRLKETDTKEVIETGHGLYKPKHFAYKTSDLRLIEALENPHVCDRILKYNVHKERKGSNRFAKGMSETFETLHGLVNKGVKVDLGYPYEMWDKPSAEVTMMNRRCYDLVESYEENIEDWYYNHQDEDLASFLCTDIILKDTSDECLVEKHIPKTDKDDDNEEGKETNKDKKMKGEKGHNQGSKNKKEEL